MYMLFTSPLGREQEMDPFHRTPKAQLLVSHTKDPFPVKVSFLKVIYHINVHTRTQSYLQ